MKKFSLDDIADQLRGGREIKGLSQRELSDLAGVTQSQISRIERGVLDPQLTTLVELARALDLELMLVPRKALSAVRGIVGSAAGVERDPAQARAVAQELGRLNDVLSRARQLPEAERTPSDALHMFARQLIDLGRFNPSLIDPGELRKVSRMLREEAGDPDAFAESLSDALEALRLLRNRAVHASRERPREEASRAAYSVSETEDG